MIDRRIIPLLMCLLLPTIGWGFETFVDSFNAGGVIGIADLNSNIPARQSGTQTSTYTSKEIGNPSNLTGINGDSQVFLDDVLILRTFYRAGGANQAAAAFNTDFASPLANERYEISFDFRLAKGGSASTDRWMAFSLGDGSSSPPAGPLSVGSDWSMLIRDDGRYTRFEDGANLGGGTAIPLPGTQTNRLVFTVDERVSPPLVSAALIAAGNSYTLFTNTTWDVEGAERLMEFRGHQGGSNGDENGANTLFDSRIENFRIDRLDAPTDPPSFEQEPGPQHLAYGSSARLDARAAGAVPLTYQWYRNGSPLNGAHENFLVLSNLTLHASDLYTLVATNINGAATSAVPVSVFYPTPQQRDYELPGPSSRSSGMVISEIMYHPADDLLMRELEFIELYNSTPFCEDLSGYRLSGEVDFTFPSNTLLQAHSYLVIAANTTDLSSASGVTNLLGNYHGALSNNEGTIRLRKRSGGIIAEAHYIDTQIHGTDGEGHSWELVRPSFGPDDARSWERSRIFGGSPGIENPIPTNHLNHLVINEIIAHTDPPNIDGLELYNRSPLTLDLSGCRITDDLSSTNMFVFPSNTTLGAYGHIARDEVQLGFSLSAAGETVYLLDPHATRLIDVVSFKGQGDGISLGRTPDGAPTVQPLQAPTFGATNSWSWHSDVVINEIMFHPISESNEDEWIELINRSTNTIDLTGWKLKQGVSYTFPTGSIIAADGYVVVAANRGQMITNYPSLSASIVYGAFEGKLSNTGESLSLTRPDSRTNELGVTEFFDIPVDRFTYRDRTRWSTWADGGGSSLELIHPDADSTVSANWRDSDETEKAPWSTIESTATLAFVMPVVQADRVQVMTLGPAEVLIDNVEVIPDGGTNIVFNPGFEAGTTNWIGLGSHRHLSLETDQPFAGTQSLRLRSTSRGDQSPNHVRAPLFRILNEGDTATLRARVRWQRGHPELLIRLMGNGIDAAGRMDIPTNLGTPGARNSQFTNNLPPQITQISHLPILPPADVPVRITADLENPSSPTVQFRIDPSTNLTTIAMRDDGLGGDVQANDQRFTATLPGFPTGTLVSFNVVDNGSTYPFEGLVRVGEEASTDPFPDYRLWLTAATRNTWRNQHAFSNDPYPVTFVYGNQRAIYAATSHKAGGNGSNPDPLGPAQAFDIFLPNDQPILNRNQLLLDWPVRDSTNQRQQLMHEFCEQLGIPNLYRRDIHFTINGTRYFYLYHDAQQPDSDVVHQFFSNDDDGLIIKSSEFNEADDTGANIVGARLFNELGRFVADDELRTARYRWDWRPRGVDTQLDFSDLFHLVNTVNTNQVHYESAVKSLVDIENWMTTFAMNDLASFWDAFGNPGKKNTYLYKPEQGRWGLISWDFDVGLGVFNDNWNRPLFDANIDPTVQRMYNYPPFIRHYWRTLSDSVHTFFQSSEVSPLLAKKYQVYLDADITITSPFVPSGAFALSITDWIDLRRDFILSEIAAIDAPLTVTGPSTTTNHLITLVGTAPLSIKNLQVNGRPLLASFTNTTSWTAVIALQPGNNTLDIQGLDSKGSIITNTQHEVSFNGAITWPPLRINEWVADADNGDPDWIELFNPTTNAVNISGWFLSDTPVAPFAFIVPNGNYVVPENGFLNILADNIPTANRPDDPQLHTNFKLSANGESILLSAPDQTQIDVVTFGAQLNGFATGRSPDGGMQTGPLLFPTPLATNANPPRSPTLAVDGRTLQLENLETNFLYSIEVTTNLQSSAWQIFQSEARATNNLWDILISPDHTRRYYRGIRRP